LGYIVHVGAGTAGAGTTSVAPTVSALALAGDMLLLAIPNKYPTNGPALPTGGGSKPWTLLGQVSGGAGAAGIDSGTVYATMFWKVCETADISATITSAITSGNSATSRIYAFRKLNEGDWEIPVLVTGSVNAAGTAWSVTTAALDLRIDDFVVAFSAINGNTYSYSGQALTPASVATDFTIFPTATLSDNSTGQGDDCGYVVTTHNVADGIGQFACTYAMTASGTAGSEPAGATILCRLRLRGSYVTKIPARRARALILKRKRSPSPPRTSIAEEVEKMRRMQR